MNKFISFFTKQPSGKRAESKKWKYGFLIFFLALLIFQIALWIVRPLENSGNYSGFVVSMMLVLGHLASYFKFGPVLTAFIRVLACLWIIVGFLYILLTSRIIL